MTSTLAIRRCEERDTPQVIQILDATWTDTWAPRMPVQKANNWYEANISARYVAKCWPFLQVAERVGAIVGFVHVGGAEIRSLHVTPVAQRSGIGRALVAAAELEIRGFGHGEAKVETESYNDGALAFYQALGYVVTGARDDDVLGVPTRLIVLGKRL